ncbi:MAG: hypothetical protein K5871_01375 [Lachnospiraceae bacterium]|nr:hypothetical protein [Lachnospiraceae bacterium]
MYINMTKIYIQLGIWSVIAVFSFTSIFVFVGTAVEYGDVNTVPVFIIFTLIAAALSMNYIKTMVYITRLKALDNVFRADSDGSVPVSEVAGYLNTTPLKLMRMKNYAEKKKILINLVYDAQGDRFILTDRYNPANPVTDRPFVGLSCPGCGAGLKIRAGATGVCPYCDRSVTAPNIMVG